MADIYMVGVGGQGIITASRVIGDAAVLAGKNVLLSETHGMAQRGGTVVCTARIGDVHSPLIPAGKIDVILSFELLETMRAACYASKDTIVISADQRVTPVSVSQKRMHYPSNDEVKAAVLERARAYHLVEASRMAEKAGAGMSSNLVMVGALVGTGITGIDERHFEKAIGMNVPTKTTENLKAFRKGITTTSRPA